MAKAQLIEKHPPATEAKRGAHGTFYWNELLTRDVEKAKKFYAATIGWSFEPMPAVGGGTYWVAKLGEQFVGGIFDLNGPAYEGVSEQWMSYLAVDDVDSRARKAVAAGATLIKTFDIPNVGRIAMLREPGGAGIGWMTPVSKE
jgi:predicted enzyme related to lactoylglutathione lyase